MLPVHSDPTDYRDLLTPILPRRPHGLRSCIHGYYCCTLLAQTRPSRPTHCQTSWKDFGPLPLICPVQTIFGRTDRLHLTRTLIDYHPDWLLDQLLPRTLPRADPLPLSYWLVTGSHQTTNYRLIDPLPRYRTRPDEPRCPFPRPPHSNTGTGRTIS